MSAARFFLLSAALLMSVSVFAQTKAASSNDAFTGSVRALAIAYQDFAERLASRARVTEDVSVGNVRVTAAEINAHLADRSNYGSFLYAFDEYYEIHFQVHPLLGSQGEELLLFNCERIECKYRIDKQDFRILPFTDAGEE
ncbi:MAG: hypothetical protein LBB55_06465 [Zoogloeaceae bacterium]|jgi:hypothetical protein|nr:hypothetical protein [Zoogloeaceae bacterium]